MEKEELKIDGLGRKRGTVHAPWRIGFFMPHFLFFIFKSTDIPGLNPSTCCVGRACISNVCMS